MGKIAERLKNHIQLHTSDMEAADYISLMREISEWATFEADRLEYGDELEEILNRKPHEHKITI